MDVADVVVAGAGQAAVQLAASLRQGGFKGRIVLIGAEAGLPYQRPPLSKAYLLGQMQEPALALRPESFYAAQAIDCRAGVAVTAIDRAARLVTLSDGSQLGYGQLVLATGARNRSLPGGALALRTLDDARHLRGALGTAKSTIIVGAGFIGLEFAAVAAARGLEVTVLEAGPRALGRGVSAEMAHEIVKRHLAWGTRFRFGVGVEAVHPTGVTLRGGETLEADLVLVAIGVVPNAEIAAAAGLAVDGGIVVDAELRTSDPHIHAIGDCARFPLGGAMLRLESVQNAADQARCVADTLLGKPADYAKVPWFWSDQGNVKLQIAGLAAGYDRAVLRREGEGMSVFCFAGPRLVAVESLNRPAEHMAARMLLARPNGLTPEMAQDPAVDLRQA